MDDSPRVAQRWGQPLPAVAALRWCAPRAVSSPTAHRRFRPAPCHENPGNPVKIAPGKENVSIGFLFVAGKHKTCTMFECLARHLAGRARASGFLRTILPPPPPTLMTSLFQSTRLGFQSTRLGVAIRLGVAALGLALVAPMPAGTFSTAPWTNDASSGIASGVTTWAYRFGSTTNPRETTPPAIPTTTTAAADFTSSIGGRPSETASSPETPRASTAAPTSRRTVPAPPHPASPRRRT